MNSYVKLFSSLLDSTVWYTSPPTKVVWIALLAMADRDGIVEASVPGLASRAGVTREECEAALTTFLSPDPDSRTKDYEGRRIEVIDGGWLLLNYEKYRDKASIEEKREKDAARQRRKRQRDASTKVTTVTKSRLSSDLISEESQEAEAAPPPTAPLTRRHGDPEVQKLLDAIEAEPVLLAIAPPDRRRLAELAMPVGKRKPLEWLLRAVADAVADFQTGEQAHVTQKRLRAYLGAARAPREGPQSSVQQTSPTYRDLPDEPELLESLRANRKVRLG